MPFKSEAQRRKFGALVEQGKISQETFDEWNSATGHKKLPERAPKLPKGPGIVHPVKPKHVSVASIVKYRKNKYGG